jgi:hypothetical protein
MITSEDLMVCSNENRALLDTTVQLDRVKMASRNATLNSILAPYRFRFTTSFALVEFKATLIQECITIHNELRRKGARFTWVRDALLEKAHRQSRLRAHIFNNFINVFACSSFNVTLEKDELLAEKARLLLENHIPRLFQWFSSADTVDSVLRDDLLCDRATEAPQKKSVAFTTNLPNCQRGRNKNCRVEEMIRSRGTGFLEKIRDHIGDSEQLARAVEVFQSVLSNPKTELSVNDCRSAGDCLIALEGEWYATHALSSNAREWSPLSKCINMEFVHISYPEERTH